MSALNASLQLVHAPLELEELVFCHQAHGLGGDAAGCVPFRNHPLQLVRRPRLLWPTGHIPLSAAAISSDSAASSAEPLVTINHSGASLTRTFAAREVMPEYRHLGTRTLMPHFPACPSIRRPTRTLDA